MEDGRSRKKRKAQDYHSEGGNMHTEQQEGKKKQKKKKRKEEQRKQRDANAMSSSSRDQAALKLKRKEKKPKICGGDVPSRQRERELKSAGAFREEGEECSNGVSVHIEQVCDAKKKVKNVAHLLCKEKGHNQLQEHGSHHAHVDHNAFPDRAKRERKKVRFSDQFATCKCKQSLSEEVCSRNSGVFKESLANGWAEEANFLVSCSCNEDNSKEETTQDGSMNSNVGQVGKAKDGKGLLTHKRPKDEGDEVWGKRFTPEEDELLKNAVLEYVKSKGWEEQEGINKVFNSKKHKDARNCWADISCRDNTDGHRTSIKEKWRSLKRTKGKGVWTQGELQQLYDLVHTSLRAKALISKKKRKLDRHILRDDINWENIADTIGTHNHGSCCGKWYYNLQSSLVTDGLWADEDDLLLLESLLKSGACVEEEVEWDSLLNHRSGQVCLMRWKQMVKHLGENRTRQFLDKLDILARRYAPELLESSAEEMSSIQENPCANAKIGDS